MFHCNEVEEGGRCSLILVFQVIMVYKLKERGIDSIQLQRSIIKEMFVNFLQMANTKECR